MLATGTTNYACENCGETWTVQYQQEPDTGAWIVVRVMDCNAGYGRRTSHDVGDIVPEECPFCGYEGNAPSD